MAGTRTWADGDVPSASDFNGYFRDQVVTICTSGTRPTTSQNGRLIFETDTNRYYRWSTALSAWVHILGGSVTWSNPMTGVTIGDGTWAGSYTRSGDLVIVSGKLTWGSTTSISGTIGLTLPISPTAGGALWCHARANYATGHSGTAVITSGSTTVADIVGPATAWNSTEPFSTWSAGYSITLNGSYFG